MNALFLYAAVVALIVLLSIVVLYNFLRYRFTGDRTFVFVTLFVVFFIGSIGFTLTEYFQTGGTTTQSASTFF
jgi:ABC-type maltose transport system permease subunit